MRVGIDVSLATVRLGGVSVYTEHLVRAILAADPETQYTLLPLFYYIEGDPRRAPPFAAPNAHVVFDRMSARRAARLWARPATRKRHLAGLDVVHSTSFCVPEEIEAPIVVTIYDLTFLTHPECHDELTRVHCLNGTIAAVLRAAHILVISEHTRAELVRLFGISPDRVTVTHCGLRPGFRPIACDDARVGACLRRLGLGRPFVLAIGTVEPRKNYSRLLEAFAGLPGDLDLVVAGGARGAAADELRALAGRLGVGRRLRLLGFVDDADLPCLLGAARALAYVSLAEGFGLPVLEGLAAGTTCVVTRAGSLPEVAGEAAVYVDPLDPSSIRGGLEIATGDESLRARLAAEGPARARGFTWGAAASRTIAVYRRMAGSPARVPNAEPEVACRPPSA